MSPRGYNAAASSSDDSSVHTTSPVSEHRPSGPPNRVYVSPYPPLTQASQPAVFRAASVASSASSSTRTASSSAATATMPTSRSTTTNISEEQKSGLVRALNEHRINTIADLRRTERIFAEVGSSDLTQPMTAAWTYFVNSHSLLNELRQACPSFSSECLDEAKRRVYQDPASNRSWNLCWLVLNKIRNDGLIAEYAQMQASRPEMWGGRSASSSSVDRLRQQFVRDWTAAVVQFLKYWDRPPVR